VNTKIAILISGRGSNMLALAQSQNLPTAVVERSGRSRDEHDRELVTVLQEHHVDFVCLAGYMRLLSSQFLSAYRNRILNIHPSLLPAFPGLDAQRQALEHGAKFSGCTVHFVDQTLDGGPIIAQRVEPVLGDDTEETLSARILDEEHKLYEAALAIVAGGGYEIVGRRVVLK